MGKAKKAPKFAAMKKIITKRAIKKYLTFFFPHFYLYSVCFITIIIGKSYIDFFFFLICCHYYKIVVFSYKEDVLNPNKKDLTKEKMPRNV